MSKSFSPYGAVVVPDDAAKQVTLRGVVTPEKLLAWHLTCINVFRGMCWISETFKTKQHVDVLEKVEQANFEGLSTILLRAGITGAAARKFGLGFSTAAGPEPVASDSLDDDSSSIQSLDVNSVGHPRQFDRDISESAPDLAPLFSTAGVDDLEVDADDDVASDRDGSRVGSTRNGRGIPSTRQSEMADPAVAERLSVVLHSPEFISEQVKSFISAVQEATRYYRLAKLAVIVLLFAGPDPCVAPEIISQIKARIGREAFETHVSKADLASLLGALSNEIVLKGTINMVPMVAWYTFNSDFHMACNWRYGSQSLASYFAQLDAARDVFEVQCQALGHKAANQVEGVLIGNLLSNLKKDVKLLDFFKPWIYDGKEVPAGGFGSMKRLLVAWLQQHHLFDTYGFNGSSTNSKQNGKPSGEGKLAVNAAAGNNNNNNNNKRSTTKKSGSGGEAKKSDYVKICKFCAKAGHELSECRRYAAAGKPSITTEQTEAYRAKVTEVVDNRKKAGSTGTAKANSVASGKASVSPTSDSDGNASANSSQLVYFVKTVNTIVVLNNVDVPGTSVRDPRGEQVPLFDLIQLDNGANASIYLVGAPLQQESITYRGDISLSTVNGMVNGIYVGHHPCVPEMEWLHTHNAASCIISDFQCILRGWTVHYIDHNSTALVTFSESNAPLIFERYDNGLLYMRINSFEQQLQENTAAHDAPIPLHIARALATNKAMAAQRQGAVAQYHADRARYHRGQSMASCSGMEDGIDSSCDAVSHASSSAAALDPLLQKPSTIVDDTDCPIMNSKLVTTAATAASLDSGNTGEDDESENDSPSTPKRVPIDNVHKPDVPHSDDDSDDDAPGIGHADADHSVEDPTSGTSTASDTDRESTSSDGSVFSDVYGPPCYLDNLSRDYTTKGTAVGYGRRKLNDDLVKLKTQVRELHLAYAHAPYKVLAEMADKGKLVGCTLTRAHILAVSKLLGECNECLLGKQVASSHPAKDMDDGIDAVVEGSNKHEARADILFVKSKQRTKQPVLVFTDIVLAFTNAVVLNSRSFKDVSVAVRKCIDYLGKYGIVITRIHSDREGAFVELGASMQFCYSSGPGSHEYGAERDIQTIRQIFRTVKVGLSFNLPRSLYPRLLEYCTFLKNLMVYRGTTASPDELLTGRKVPSPDLILGRFGRIATFSIPKEEARLRRLDDSDAIAEFGVVIGLEHSNTRNLKVFLPFSDQIVMRRGGKDVTDLRIVIDKLNAIAAAEEAQCKGKSDPDSSDTFVMSTSSIPSMSLSVSQACQGDDGIPMTMAAAAAPSNNGVTDAVTFRTDADGTGRVITDSMTGNEYYIRASEMNRISLTRAKATLPPSMVTAAVINELVVNMGKYEVWRYCLPASVRGKHVLRSMLFLKVKTLPNGDFDKLKARLVPDGSMQREDEFARSSSPTVGLPSLFIIFGLAKLLKAQVVTVDIPAAYLNATLREEIYMRLDRNVSDILVAHDDTLQQYVTADGSIIVRLLKGLYGLKQSGYEWHQVIRDFVVATLQYKQSLADRCVFYKGIGDNLHVVAIHVDDLFMLFRNNEERLFVQEELTKKFGAMTFADGKQQNYIGMHLKILPDHSIFASQHGYLKTVCQEYSAWRVSTDPKFKLRAYTNPSTSDLMELTPVPKEDAPVNKRFKELVLHFVYSLLYPATHTRPDIVFPVVMLATIVSAPPMSILKHLDRVYGYVQSTLTKGMLFGAVDTALVVMADTGYAVHKNGKSHTGLLITMGGSPVDIASAKQKLVTLSSTEAELEGLVQALKRLQPIRRLLGELQLLQEPARVLQDNKSTITIARSGEGYCGNSKHFRVRYAAVSEQYENGEITLEHLPGVDMPADMMSKADVGPNFTRLRDMVVQDEPTADDV